MDLNLIISPRSHCFWHGCITWFPGYQGDWASFPMEWECCCLYVLFVSESRKGLVLHHSFKDLELEQIPVSSHSLPPERPHRVLVNHPLWVKMLCPRRTRFFISEEPQIALLVVLKPFKLLHLFSSFPPPFRPSMLTMEKLESPRGPGCPLVRQEGIVVGHWHWWWRVQEPVPPQTELKQGMGRWCPVNSHDALFSNRGPHPAALVFIPPLLKSFSIFPTGVSALQEQQQGLLHHQTLCWIVGV